jgi:hypothetical protein
MSQTIQLSDKAERTLSTIAAEQGLTPEEFLRRFIEAWAALLTDESHDPDQAWFWTPEWQAGERAADADLAAGRSSRYDSDEAFAKALEEHIGEPAHGLADADS